MSTLPGPTYNGTSLFNTPQAGATKYEDQFLEQYKIYVDSSQKVSDRRISVNNYMLAINSSLLTLTGLLANLLEDRRSLTILALAGLLVSITWFFLLQSFKRLNAAKFDVIQELERHLPANMFEEEWRRLTTGPRRPYWAMSDLERMVPIVFLVFYPILAIILCNLPAGQGSKTQKIELQAPVQVEMKTPAALPAAQPMPSPTPPKADKKHKRR